MKTLTTIIALTALFYICVSQASTVSHVIHISVDGLYAKAISSLGEQKLPNFTRLKNEGASTLSARTDTDFTDTLPNHTTQLTGRRVERNHQGHGWIFNIDPGALITVHINAGEYINSIFDSVHDAGLSTGLYASKQKFTLFKRSWNSVHGAADTVAVDNGKNKIDKYVFNTNTARLITNFITDLADQPRHYAFLHIRDPDTAGHDYSWSLTPNSPYLNAIVNTDQYLGEILDFIETDTEYKESTALILTSDHGGALGQTDHPESSYQSHAIPFYVWGASVTHGDLYEINPCTSTQPAEQAIPDYSEDLQPVRNGDAANLSASLLGLPLIDGAHIKTIKNYKSSVPPSCTPALSSIQLLLDDD